MTRNPPLPESAAPLAARFDYDTAFSRNIGWVTEWEQQLLRTRRVAIAGMGGVGGAHLLTLTRLGIGKFHVADMDVFDTVNFNRQVGASTSTLGRAKVDVMAEMALDINPTAEIRRFQSGVSDENIDAFLKGVDLFVDGFDFFVLDMRAKVFARCAELGIPAVTAAPIGMGTAYLVFMPGGMTFEQYFGLAGQPLEQQYVNFLLGLTPKALHRSSLVDTRRLDLAKQRGPSTGMACQICAGVTGAEVLRILLGRGGVKPAPWFHQFDAFRGRLASGRLRGGARNPLQRLRQKLGLVAMRAMARAGSCSPPETPLSPRPDIEQILEIARWAPSGDNSQPWRFRIQQDDRLTVLATSDTASNIYEYNHGQPTLLSVGCLLESLRIAASGFGRGMSWTCRRRSFSEGGLLQLEIDVNLPRDAAVQPDPLLGFVKLRSVARTAFRREPLTGLQKTALAQALGPEMTLAWFDSWPQRWSFARLGAQATDIRLRSRQAYDVHRQAIDWDDRFSRGGMPGTAIGLTPMTQRIMRWAMADFSRIDRMNRFAGGTRLAQLELDLIPGLACASHFTIGWHQAGAAAASTEDLLQAGQRIQRFWLTATSMGLAVQPGMAALIFAHYADPGSPLAASTALVDKAGRLASALRQVTGSSPNALLFMGRIGRPRSTLCLSRSHRLPLEELIIHAEPQTALA